MNVKYRYMLAFLLAASTVMGPLTSASFAQVQAVGFADLYARAEAFHESIGEATKRAEQAAYEQDKVFAQLMPRLSVESTIMRREDAPTPIHSKEVRETSVRLGQTLYTGGRATIQLKIATIGEIAGGLGVRDARERLIFQVAEAYFGVLKAEENLSSVNERLAGMKRHLEAARARVRLGAAVLASALRMESEVAQLAAEQLATENERATAREQLAILTGAPPRMEPGPPPDLAPIRALVDPVALALEDRTDLNILFGETVAAQLGVRFTTGLFLPTVDLEGVYATASTDPKSNFATDEDTFAILKATWNLFNGGGDLAERRRARAAFNEKSLQLDRRRREIRTEVAQATRQVAVADRIVAALDGAMTYASENHRIVTETYKAGAATYLDVIDASNTLGDARRDRANARFDYSLALMNMARVTGQLVTVIGEEVPSYTKLKKWGEKRLK